MSGVPNVNDTFSSRQPSKFIAEEIIRQSRVYSESGAVGSDSRKIKDWLNVLLGGDDVYLSKTSRRSSFWPRLLIQQRENGSERWTEQISVRLPKSTGDKPRPWIIRITSGRCEDIAHPWIRLAIPPTRYYVAESFRGVCKSLTDSSVGFDSYIGTSLELREFLNSAFVSYHSEEVCHAIEAWDLIFR